MHGDMYTPVPVYRDKAVMKPFGGFLLALIVGLALAMTLNHFLSTQFMALVVGFAMGPLLRDLASTTRDEFRANKQSNKARKDAAARRDARVAEHAYPY